MIRFFLRLIVWVTVARWMYAEAALVMPSSVPYIEAALHHIQIPTHDRWKDSQLGQRVLSALPSSGEIRSQLVARVDRPIRDSAMTLQQVGFALSSKQGSRFEEF